VGTVDGKNAVSVHGCRERSDVPAPKEDAEASPCAIDYTVVDGRVVLTDGQRRTIAESVKDLRMPKERRMAMSTIFHIAVAQGDLALALEAVKQARLEFSEYLKHFGGSSRSNGTKPAGNTARMVRSRSVTVEARDELTEAYDDMEAAVADIGSGQSTFAPQRKDDAQVEQDKADADGDDK